MCMLHLTHWVCDGLTFCKVKNYHCIEILFKIKITDHLKKYVEIYFITLYFIEAIHIHFSSVVKILVCMQHLT